MEKSIHVFKTSLFISTTHGVLFLKGFFHFKIELTQSRYNKAILFIVQPIICQNIVFLMLIREEDYFEIILNALCLETHNISLKFKTEIFFFLFPVPVSTDSAQCCFYFSQFCWTDSKPRKLRVCSFL